jgi:hypothetical protein
VWHGGGGGQYTAMAMAAVASTRRWWWSDDVDPVVHSSANDFQVKVWCSLFRRGLYGKSNHEDAVYWNLHQLSLMMQKL